MPTNRTRRTRNLRPAIDPAEVYYLQHGTSEGGPPHEHVEFFMRRKTGWASVWEDVRERVTDDWIRKHPGTRPWAFWEYDAPRRDTGTGAFFEPLPEPRRRIGGQGQTTWEKYPAVVPEYERGIPSSWAEIDPDDPPRYESESAFLLRNDLLTPAEIKYLAAHPELLAPEVVMMDEEADEGGPAPSMGG